MIREDIYLYRPWCR